jgi:hypothetical protein
VPRFIVPTSANGGQMWGTLESNAALEMRPAVVRSNKSAAELFLTPFAGKT